ALYIQLSYFAVNLSVYFRNIFDEFVHDRSWNNHSDVCSNCCSSVAACSKFVRNCFACLNVFLERHSIFHCSKFFFCRLSLIHLHSCYSCRRIEAVCRRFVHYVSSFKLLQLYFCFSQFIFYCSQFVSVTSNFVSSSSVLN